MTYSVRVTNTKNPFSGEDIVLCTDLKLKEAVDFAEVLNKEASEKSGRIALVEFENKFNFTDEQLKGMIKKDIENDKLEEVSVIYNKNNIILNSKLKEKFNNKLKEKEVEFIPKPMFGITKEELDVEKKKIENSIHNALECMTSLVLLPIYETNENNERTSTIIGQRLGDYVIRFSKKSDHMTYDVEFIEHDVPVLSNIKNYESAFNIIHLLSAGLPINSDEIMDEISKDKDYSVQLNKFLSEKKEILWKNEPGNIKKQNPYEFDTKTIVKLAGLTYKEE